MLARAATAAFSTAVSSATSAALQATGATVALSSLTSAVVGAVAASVGSSAASSAAGGYKRESTQQERSKESERLRAQFPDRVPVIVEPADERQPPVDKRKFLVPADLTVGQLMYVVRKRIKLPAEQALFFAVADARAIPPAAALISEIFERHADPDGHLYMTYCTEHAFGAC